MSHEEQKTYNYLLKHKRDKAVARFDVWLIKQLYTPADYLNAARELVKRDKEA